MFDIDAEPAYQSVRVTNLAAHREPTPGMQAPQRHHVWMLRDVAGRVTADPDADRVQDHEALDAQLTATRALLRATTVGEIAAVIVALVRDLGGGVVPARFADKSNSLPLDISLDPAEPLVPWVEPVSIAAMRMEQLLPGFMQDARLVLTQVQASADASLGSL